MSTKDDGNNVADKPFSNGLRPEDFVQLEQDRRRAALLAKDGSRAQIQQLKDTAGFLFLAELFMGMKDDESLSSDQATNELAQALGLDVGDLRELQDETSQATARLESITFPETVRRIKSGELSILQAARATYNNAPGGISEREISAASEVISRYASSGNPLLEVIAAKESRGNYNVVYGGREVNLTGKTIDQVLAWQDKYVHDGSASSAAGKYQIIRKTLRGLKSEMGLSGDEPFDEEMQDRMAMKLLEIRGYSKFLAGEISEKEFMLRISKEWASMPKNALGRSYYAGDGLNKAHETPANLVAAMRITKDIENSGSVANSVLVASADKEEILLEETLAFAFGKGEGTDLTLNPVDPMIYGVSAAFTLDVITNQGTDQVSMVVMDASTSDLMIKGPVEDLGLKQT